MAKAKISCVRGFFCSVDFKYETEVEDYIEADTESIDKSSNTGQRTVYINTDDSEYSHQIALEDFQEDDEDALEPSQYEQGMISTPANGKGSSVYYITSTSANNANTNVDTQPQSSQRQMKIIPNATTTTTQNDPDERFLLSCLPTLKRLSNRKNAMARVKIQQLLYEIEFDADMDAVNH